MYFLHAINSDRQTRLLNVLGQIAMILGDKKKAEESYSFETSGVYIRSYTVSQPRKLSYEL